MYKHSQAHNLLSSYIYTPQVYAAYWTHSLQSTPFLCDDPQGAF